jgi:general secretion pathway protein I
MEVMIAFAILASALVVLMGTMANAGQQSVFASDLTIASQLARSKMIDVEYELMDEGFSDMNQTFRGDFREEGYPDITWEARVLPVEIPETSKEEFLAQINSQLFGGESQGALQGNAAFSAMLPMLIGQLPEMINQIGKKVRRVNLVVEFPYGTTTYPIKITQYAVEEQEAGFNIFDDAAPIDGEGE